MNEKDISSKESDEFAFYPMNQKQEEIIKIAKQIKSENASYFYGGMTGPGSG